MDHVICVGAWHMVYNYGRAYGYGPQSPKLSYAIRYLLLHSGYGCGKVGVACVRRHTLWHVSEGTHIHTFGVYIS